MKRIKSVCKTNQYLEHLEDYFEYRHLVPGKIYEFEEKDIDGDVGYTLITDESVMGYGYVFFKEKPVFQRYDFHHFFMSIEEMRNVNIDEILTNN